MHGVYVWCVRKKVMVKKVKSDLVSCSALLGYVSPEVNILVFQPEGVLCLSSEHEGFGDGGEYDL